MLFVLDVEFELEVCFLNWKSVGFIEFFFFLGPTGIFFFLPFDFFFFFNSHAPRAKFQRIYQRLLIPQTAPVNFACEAKPLVKPARWQWCSPPVNPNRW